MISAEKTPGELSRSVSSTVKSVGILLGIPQYWGREGVGQRRLAESGGIRVCDVCLGISSVQETHLHTSSQRESSFNDRWVKECACVYLCVCV